MTQPFKALRQKNKISKIVSIHNKEIIAMRLLLCNNRNAIAQVLPAILKTAHERYM